jgi:hypothetical protein
MKFRVEIVCLSEGQEDCGDILEIERDQLAMETLGLNLRESKLILENVQDFMVAQQVDDDLKRRRNCQDCGRPHTQRGGGTRKVKTLFGPVEVENPRWNHCVCQPCGQHTRKASSR